MHTTGADRLRQAGWALAGVLTVAAVALLSWLVVIALTPGTVAAVGAPVNSPVRAAPAAEPGHTGDDAGGADVGITDLVDAVWVDEIAETTRIPPRALAAYAGADLRVRDETGCAVGWNTLAGIGHVESEHGTIHGGSIDEDAVARPHIFGIALDGTRSARIDDTDGGALDGDARWDRAVGPMQFIPDTWANWGADGDGDGVADVHNIDDAALAAARYLCHARGTLVGSEAWNAAILSYNADAEYVRRVTDAAVRYGLLGER